jgi:excinuclease ABC subunit C
MQYHIKRCTAPCVNNVTHDVYANSVRRTIDFLKGKTHEVQHELAERMEQASAARDYEHAAMYRDQIKALTQLQSQQTINTTVIENADIFGLYQQGEHVCIQVFFFRTGSNYGSFSLYPKHVEGLNPGEILASILPLFYEDKDPPAEILLSHDIPERALMEQAFRDKTADGVKIAVPKRGEKLRFMEHAVKNAREALERHLSHAQSHRKAMFELSQVLGLDKTLTRIEVYDNSHISGTDAIGAMIVVGPEGFQKKDYRKFTIKQQEIAGDDYAMMREVLGRRFSGSLAADRERNPFPDLLLIDGGQGQVNVVAEVLKALEIEVPILGIAKGPQRNAGRETFYQPDKAAFVLEQQPNVLYFLQRIRDEAHRFAIGTHRAKRMKRISETVITDIPGIGAARKKALLLHFGSGKAVQNARVEDLENVEGISAALARKIYAFFHDA